MPQLMTKVWFMVLIMTWAVFLYILPPKISSYKPLNNINPTHHTATHSSVASWTWSW